MNNFDTDPDLCLEFLQLPLPQCSQLALLLDQKIQALFVLIQIWPIKIRQLKKLKQFAITKYPFVPSHFFGRIDLKTNQLFDFFRRVYKLQHSLKKVIPALHWYNFTLIQKINNLDFHCFLFLHQVFSDSLIQLDLLSDN